MASFFERVRFAYLRRVAAPLLRLCGPRFANALAIRLADGVFQLATPGRLVAEARVRQAFGIRAGRCSFRLASDPRAANNAAEMARMRALVAAHYRHLARFWAECLFIARMDGDDWRRTCRVADEAAWLRLGDRSRPLIVVAAYHGNVAVAACALARLIGPVHVVYDRAEHPALAAWQRELISRLGLVPIDRREAARIVPGVLEACGVVMMIGEHHRKRGAAVPVEFLGRRLRAYPTVGRLAQWYGARVAVVSCLRHEVPMAFTLSCDAVVDPVAHADAASIVRATFAAMERQIRRSPQQYLWSWGGSVEPADAYSPGDARATPAPAARTPEAVQLVEEPGGTLTSIHAPAT